MHTHRWYIYFSLVPLMAWYNLQATGNTNKWAAAQTIFELAGKSLENDRNYPRAIQEFKSAQTLWRECLDSDETTMAIGSTHLGLSTAYYLVGQHDEREVHLKELRQQFNIPERPNDQNIPAILPQCVDFIAHYWFAQGFCAYSHYEQVTLEHGLQRLTGARIKMLLGHLDVAQQCCRLVYNIAQAHNNVPLAAMALPAGGNVYEAMSKLYQQSKAITSAIVCQQAAHDRREQALRLVTHIRSQDRTQQVAQANLSLAKSLIRLAQLTQDPTEAQNLLAQATAHRAAAAAIDNSVPIDDSDIQALMQDINHVHINGK